MQRRDAYNFVFICKARWVQHKHRQRCAWSDKGLSKEAFMARLNSKTYKSPACFWADTVLSPSLSEFRWDKQSLTK